LARRARLQLLLGIFVWGWWVLPFAMHTAGAALKSLRSLPTPEPALERRVRRIRIWAGVFLILYVAVPIVVASQR
jgi:uncharacterized membrane protein